MAIIDIGNVGLGAIQRVTDLWRASKSESLIDYTQPARVEPIVLVDGDIVHYEHTPDVMQSLNSIFAGYYLQAAAMMTTLGNIQVMRQLERLNPNRNPADAAANSVGWMMATESYKDGLPTFGRKKALEAITDAPDEAENELERQNQLGIHAGRDSLKQVAELANLSVGKLINVEVIDGAYRATIPVSIRLIASSLPQGALVEILSHGNVDTTAKERFWSWKGGRLEFIRDILMCDDLIKEHRKNLMKDKDNLYATIIKRRRGNQLSTIVSGNPSIASVSNMAVISRATAMEVEAKYGGRMKEMKLREKMMADTSLMIIAVVDKDWDRVTFYHKGIPTATEVGVKDLKIANKGTGPDVAEILKAYQRAEAPSL